MSGFIRYVVVSGLLLGTTAPTTKTIRRRYGIAASRRFSAGMAGTLAAQQALVGLALCRSGGRRHRLSAVDLMTLSRGCASGILAGLAVSGIRDRRGVAGWLGWLALLYGAILCDWLDGPIARRLGTSDIGAVFDLEGDSWLTLCAAASAITWGDLPATVALAPLLRYVLLFEALRRERYAALHSDEPSWVRRMGIVQMLVFIAALAPYGGRATRLAVQLCAPMQAPLQVQSLLLLHRRGRA